jgi:DNA repair protein RecN (Recombination protein N)
LNQIDEGWVKELNDVKEMRYRLEDVQLLLKGKFERFDFDPERLKWIEERLLEVKRLKKKYGEQLFDVLSDIRLKIVELEKSEESLHQINRVIEKCQALYEEKASKLSHQRKIQSGKLEKSLMKNFEELGLKDVVFEIKIEEGPTGSMGRDLISFYISTNKGQSPKPLNEIVSGGELSRIMLALKTLLSEKDFIPILIFDEIDVNLGGQTAHKVAQKLKEVSKNHQILVVTHLAQIAAYADQHYYVEKIESDKKVKTRVRCMASKDRPKEIARMLGGHDSKVALSHAQELLNIAQR